MNILNKVKSFGALPLIFCISSLIVGVFNEFAACILSVALSVFLIAFMRKKEIKFNLNLTFFATAAIVISYLLSIFWVIDSGMAFLGFLKHLPLLLFWVCIINNRDAKEKIFSALPLLAVIMTVISAILMQFPIFSGYFSVAERLAGFFQYPNTFALFLLIAELFLISKEKFKIYEYFYLAILLFGILYTGSRTVFVLAVLSNLIAGFITKNKVVKIGIWATVGITVIGVLLFALLSENSIILDRFTRFSFTESTFVGRILYFLDAAPTILKNPFGIGYMGYYYIQQEIQTGYYSVVFVHNDFLQLMLDIGWVPSLLLISAIIKAIFNRNNNAFKKLILVVFFLHSCFDFNLQYITMFILLILLCDDESGKVITLNSKSTVPTAILAGCALLCLYMAIPLTLTYFKVYNAASSLYPYNTQNETARLSAFEDIEEAKDLADEILDRNEYVTLCYSVRSHYYYSKGDFSGVIRAKNTIFEKFPFMYEEYEEYCYMLIQGIELYNEYDDVKSAEICIEELKKVPDTLKETKGILSKFGRMIKDQPTTELPEEITEYISSLD